MTRYGAQDAKQLLRGWGGAEPNFLLINSRLTFQLQMSPERTQYSTQGSDGKRRLEEGPNLQSYRGIRIIHSHQFPMQVSQKPPPHSHPLSAATLAYGAAKGCGDRMGRPRGTCCAVACAWPSSTSSRTATTRRTPHAGARGRQEARSC